MEVLAQREAHTCAKTGMRAVKKVGTGVRGIGREDFFMHIIIQIHSIYMNGRTPKGWIYSFTPIPYKKSSDLLEITLLSDHQK